jgi:hypothetical protein
MRFCQGCIAKDLRSGPDVCPSCGKSSFKKQVTAAGFQLKGTGWYVTDFRGGSAPATGTARPAVDGAAPASGGTAPTAARRQYASSGAAPAAMPRRRGRRQQ